jgi:hypothetical protein
MQQQPILIANEPILQTLQRRYDLATWPVSLDRAPEPARTPEPVRPETPSRTHIPSRQSPPSRQQ